MNGLKRTGARGFTLLEIVLAIAIFTITLGATAQGLAYAYGLVNLQNQRVTASNDCRAVISALRQVIAADVATGACPADKNRFPCVIMDWTSRFPEDAAAVAALPAAQQIPFAGLYTLQDETITVTLTSPTGEAAVNGNGPSSSTNPVHVTVTVQWTGPRRITYTETVQTAVTNR